MGGGGPRWPSCHTSRRGSQPDLALLGWDREGGLYRGVLFAWYAARQGFGLSFYPCRRELIAGKQTLGLSPLLGQTKAA